ncbi:uncharacterized protein BDR25DRAFT_111045 [Lindgomyces ingoldianus]|uniref:Uncharacterized protein n=1 Tax=Lindgomyces ingoldianus TaxID=673940 RepID=A0ACB6R896_9PLEO|nr:uncharacterized protein BDR25DRAFT_111045 [Lindgomyces ingoldianus]KAF2474681.1 hypothetical protein BDR25DRAFT_111045 [Lindgomyces ingoldianus]
MRSQLLSFSCALVGNYLFWRVDASCYYPNGDFPSDYVYAPCSDNENATCCMLGEGDQCLSNGLCYSPISQYMFRGGCTDKSWNSPNCFQHCKTGEWSSGSYDQLVPCGGDKYCCYSDGSTCCNDDSKVFTVGTGTVIKDFSSTASYTLPIETPEGTAHPSSAANAKTTGSKGTGAQPTGSRATNSAAAATSTSQAAEQTDPHTHGVSKTAVLAGAIGGVVILILAIALVWFLVRRRYRKKLAAGSNGQGFPLSSGDGFQKLPDKSPRPVEVPAPLHPPPPPQYQPPAYQTPPPQHNAVEIDNSYLPPGRNQYGQPVYEAPAQPYRHI